MKTEKLKDLFLYSITSDLSAEERNIMDNEILNDQSFEPGFRDKIMGIVSNRRSFLNKDLMRSFNDVFYKIAIPGAAAIVILLISILLNQGSLSYDTLLGIDNSVDGVLTSLVAE